MEWVKAKQLNPVASNPNEDQEDANQVEDTMEENIVCLNSNQLAIMITESLKISHMMTSSRRGALIQLWTKSYFYYLPLYIKLHWCHFMLNTVTIYKIPDNGPLNILMLWPHFLFPMMVAHQVFRLALVRPGGRFHHIPKKLNRLSPNIPPM